jgi:hypothetical protein
VAPTINTFMQSLGTRSFAGIWCAGAVRNASFPAIVRVPGRNSRSAPSINVFIDGITPT